MDFRSVGSASTMIHLLTTGSTARVSTAFRSLCSVLGAALFPVIYTGSIKRATYDMVLDAREVLYSSAANQDDRVLLQIMPLAGDICIHFSVVAEANSTYFAQRGVGFAWSLSSHLRANAPLLRCTLQLDSPLL